MKPRRKTLIKIISLFLSGVLLIQDLSYAGAAEIRPVSVPVSTQAVLCHDPSSFAAPLQFSTPKDIYRGHSGKLFLLIQDAHNNVSGQENLARALDHVMKRYGLRLVLSEGCEGDGSLTALKKIAPERVWKKVARSFLIQSKISGEEYLNLISDKPLSIQGIEDFPLYEKNVRRYADLAGVREKTLEEVERLSRAVRKLKKKFYPADILSYEKSFGGGDDDFKRQWDALSVLAENRAVDLSGFSDWTAMRSLTQDEKLIDFNQANLEQAALFQSLSARVGEERAGELAMTNASGQRGSLAESMRHENLKRLAKDNHVSLEPYPHWRRYGEYLQKFSGLDLDRVLDQARLAEESVYEKSLETEEARLLRGLDRYLKLLSGAYQVKMTSTEFKVWQANRPDFSTEALEAFLNLKLAEAGAFEDLIAFRDVLEKGEKVLAQFYAAVDERDGVFVRRAEEALSQSQENFAALIAGGYHTEHLKELLREKGHSYIVLTPQVTSETNQAQYEKNLLEPILGVKKKVVTSREVSRQKSKSLADIGELKKTPKRLDDNVRNLGTVAAARLAIKNNQLIDRTTLGQLANAAARLAGTNETAAMTVAGELISSEISAARMAADSPDGLCVTGDTLLPIRRIEDGRLRIEGIQWTPIKDVKAGDFVLSLNEETQQIEPQRINGLMDMGIKPAFKLTTKSGRSIKTTANHPYLVKKRIENRGLRMEGKKTIPSSPQSSILNPRSAFEWIKVSDLKVGDEIGVPENLVGPNPDLASAFDDTQFSSQNSRGVFLKEINRLVDYFLFRHFVDVDQNNSAGRPNVEAKNVAKIFIETQDDTAFLLGLMENCLIIGSAHFLFMGALDIISTLTKCGKNFAVNANIGQNAMHVKSDFKGDFCRLFDKTRRKIDGIQRVFFGNGRILLGDFVEPITGAQKVQDISDGDTCAANARLAETHLGINGDGRKFGSHLALSTAKYIIRGLTRPFTLPEAHAAQTRMEDGGWRMEGECGWRMEDGGLRIMKVGEKKTSFPNSISPKASHSSPPSSTLNPPSAVQWDPIVSIEPLGPMQVYDIEVEGTHNFIGNGIFAHNTYLQGGRMAGVIKGIENGKLKIGGATANIVPGARMAGESPRSFMQRHVYRPIERMSLKNFYRMMSVFTGMQVSIAIGFFMMGSLPMAAVMLGASFLGNGYLVFIKKFIDATPGKKVDPPNQDRPTDSGARLAEDQTGQAVLLGPDVAYEVMPGVIVREETLPWVMWGSLLGGFMLSAGLFLLGVIPGIVHLPWVFGVLYAYRAYDLIQQTPTVMEMVEIRKQYHPIKAEAKRLIREAASQKNNEALQFLTQGGRPATRALSYLFEKKFKQEADSMLNANLTAGDMQALKAVVGGGKATALLGTVHSTGIKKGSERGTFLLSMAPSDRFLDATLKRALGIEIFEVKSHGTENTQIVACHLDRLFKKIKSNEVNFLLDTIKFYDATNLAKVNNLIKSINDGADAESKRSALNELVAVVLTQIQAENGTDIVAGWFLDFPLNAVYAYGQSTARLSRVLPSLALFRQFLSKRFRGPLPEAFGEEIFNFALYDMKGALETLARYQRAMNTVNSLLTPLFVDGARLALDRISGSRELKPLAARLAVPTPSPDGKPGIHVWEKAGPGLAESRPEGAIFPDRSDEIKKVVLVGDIAGFTKEVEAAIKSELSYFYFIATLNRLSEEDGEFKLALARKIEETGGIDNDDAKFFRKALPSYYDTKVPMAHLVKRVGKTIIDYSVDLGKKSWLSQATADVPSEDIEKILDQMMSQRNRRGFLARSLLALPGADNKIIEKVQRQPYLLYLQEGLFQGVYLAFVPIAGGKIAAFIVMIAKGTGETSTVVQGEYRRLSRFRKHPNIVHVLAEGGADYNGDTLRFYSSEFLDHHAEIVYDPLRKSLVPPSPSLILNSSLVWKNYDIKPVIRQSILASMIARYVTFYNPEKGFSPDDFRIGAGDIGIDERVLELEEQRAVEAIDSPKNFTLIAYRGARKVKSPSDYISGLLGLTFLSTLYKNAAVRDEKTGQIILELREGEQFPGWVLDAVLMGLQRGLIEKYGQEQGTEKTRSWLEEYLKAIELDQALEPVMAIYDEKRAITKGPEPIFDKDRIRRFIDGLPATAKLTASGSNAIPPDSQPVEGARMATWNASRDSRMRYADKVEKEGADIANQLRDILAKLFQDCKVDGKQVNLKSLQAAFTDEVNRQIFYKVIKLREKAQEYIVLTKSLPEFSHFNKPFRSPGSGMCIQLSDIVKNAAQQAGIETTSVEFTTRSGTIFHRYVVIFGAAALDLAYGQFDRSYSDRALLAEADAHHETITAFYTNERQTPDLLQSADQTGVEAEILVKEYEEIKRAIEKKIALMEGSTYFPAAQLAEGEVQSSTSEAGSKDSALGARMALSDTRRPMEYWRMGLEMVKMGTYLLIHNPFSYSAAALFYMFPAKTGLLLYPFTILAMMVALYFLRHAAESMAGTIRPTWIISDEEAKKRGEDALNAMKSQATNDPLLSRALNRVGGFVITDDYYKVLIGRKIEDGDGKFKIILTPAMTESSSSLRYLILRGAIGLDYDALFKKKNELDFFWNFYGEYQSFKYLPYYASIKNPEAFAYTFFRSLFFNGVILLGAAVILFDMLVHAWTSWEEIRYFLGRGVELLQLSLPMEDQRRQSKPAAARLAQATSAAVSPGTVLAESGYMDFGEVKNHLRRLVGSGEKVRLVYRQKDFGSVPIGGERSIGDERSIERLILSVEDEGYHSIRVGAGDIGLWRFDDPKNISNEDAMRFIVRIDAVGAGNTQIRHESVSAARVQVPTPSRQAPEPPRQALESALNKIPYAFPWLTDAMRARFLASSEIAGLFATVGELIETQYGKTRLNIYLETRVGYLAYLSPEVLYGYAREMCEKGYSLDVAEDRLCGRSLWTTVIPGGKPERNTKKRVLSKPSVIMKFEGTALTNRRTEIELRLIFEAFVRAHADLFNAISETKAQGFLFDWAMNLHDIDGLYISERDSNWFNVKNTRCLSEYEIASNPPAAGREGPALGARMAGVNSSVMAERTKKQLTRLIFPSQIRRLFSWGELSVKAKKIIQGALERALWTLSDGSNIRLVKIEPIFSSNPSLVYYQVLRDGVPAGRINISATVDGRAIQYYVETLIDDASAGLGIGSKVFEFIRDIRPDRCMAFLRGGVDNLMTLIQLHEDPDLDKSRIDEKVRAILDFYQTKLLDGSFKDTNHPDEKRSRHIMELHLSYFKVLNNGIHDPSQTYLTQTKIGRLFSHFSPEMRLELEPTHGQTFEIRAEISPPRAARLAEDVKQMDSGELLFLGGKIGFPRRQIASDEAPQIRLDTETMKSLAHAALQYSGNERYSFSFRPKGEPGLAFVRFESRKIKGRKKYQAVLFARYPRGMGETRQRFEMVGRIDLTDTVQQIQSVSPTTLTPSAQMPRIEDLGVTEAAALLMRDLRYSTKTLVQAAHSVLGTKPGSPIELTQPALLYLGFEKTGLSAQEIAEKQVYAEWLKSHFTQGSVVVVLGSPTGEIYDEGDRMPENLSLYQSFAIGENSKALFDYAKKNNMGAVFTEPRSSGVPGQVNLLPEGPAMVFGVLLAMRKGALIDDLIYAFAKRFVQDAMFTKDDVALFADLTGLQEYQARLLFKALQSISIGARLAIAERARQTILSAA